MGSGYKIMELKSINCQWIKDGKLDELSKGKKRGKKKKGRAIIWLGVTSNLL